MAPSRMQLHRARVLGSGQQTVVLGHGFGTDQSAWHNLTPLLVRRGYKVVIFDSVGAGARAANTWGSSSGDLNGGSFSDASFSGSFTDSFSEKEAKPAAKEESLVPAGSAYRTEQVLPPELKKKQQSFSQSFGESFRKLFGKKKKSKSEGLQPQPSITESELEEALGDMPKAQEVHHKRRSSRTGGMAAAAARSLQGLDLGDSAEDRDTERQGGGAEKGSRAGPSTEVRHASPPHSGPEGTSQGKQEEVRVAFDFRRYTKLEAYAEDMLLLLEELGVTECFYVGHSVSGMIGVLASLQKPSLFKKLVLLAASPRYLNDEGYHGGFTQSDLDGIFESMKSNYKSWVAGFAPAAIGDGENAAVYDFTEGLLSVQPDVALSVSKTIFQSDYRHVLPQVTVPTHILQSARDLAVPLEAAQYLHKNIKGSVFEQLPVGGHLPHLSSPELVNAAIINHLLSPP